MPVPVVTTGTGTVSTPEARHRLVDISLTRLNIRLIQAIHRSAKPPLLMPAIYGHGIPLARSSRLKRIAWASGRRLERWKPLEALPVETRRACPWFLASPRRAIASRSAVGTPRRERWAARQMGRRHLSLCMNATLPVPTFCGAKKGMTVDLRYGCQFG
jgi:hypothetical protein